QWLPSGQTCIEKQRYDRSRFVLASLQTGAVKMKSPGSGKNRGLGHGEMAILLTIGPSGSFKVAHPVHHCCSVQATSQRKRGREDCTPPGRCAAHTQVK